MEIQEQSNNGENHVTLSPLEKAVIQAVAQRIGLRISQEIVSALTEMIILMRQNPKAPTTLPATTAPHEMLDIMKVGDAAKVLRLSPAKVYQLIQRKELRALVIDRSVRVRREDLENFMQQHSES